MKFAYFGIDVLADCLRLLIRQGEVAALFTAEGDDYDRCDEVRAIAQANAIPVKTHRPTPQDMKSLADAGVEYAISAGYPWRIPVSDRLRQINIHPSPLPEGRGPWPMPVSILKNRPSGVTLHKLSQGFDEGDILLAQALPLNENETLETLTRRIAQAAPALLERFLSAPDAFWEAAQPQSGGSYDPEPTDEDRTFSAEDDPAEIDRKLRAFAGYGCLTLDRGLPVRVVRGRIEPDSGGAGIPIPGGRIAGEIAPCFRDISLDDRDAVERIRARFSPILSDYTFALLYCWRKEYGLQLALGEDFYAVRGHGFHFFPVGDPEKTERWLRLVLQSEGHVTLRFCDEAAARWLTQVFPGAQVSLSQDDSDYVIDREKLLALPGSELWRPRHDLHHFMRVEPAPTAEPITARNLPEAAALSATLSAQGTPDGGPEAEAMAHFDALQLKGWLIRRGKTCIGFALCSQKDETTLQGHFSKCADRTRGGGLFTIRSCADCAPQYARINLEDDCGVPGLRHFKRALHPDIISSYTVKMDENEKP